MAMTLEDMHQLLETLDRIEHAANAVDVDRHRRTVGEFARQAEEQCARLRDQLSAAEALTQTLRHVASAPSVELRWTR